MAMIGASLEKFIGKKMIMPGVQSDVSHTVAQQAMYLVTVAEEVATRGENTSAIAMSLLGEINMAFDQWIDARAVNGQGGHMKYHSVYEFDMAGNPAARLWYHQRWRGKQFAKSGVFLKNAKRPNREGYMFKDKAYVMQLGEPVFIQAKNAKALRFYNRKTDEWVITKQVTVPSPGGPQSAGSLDAAYQAFWRTPFPKRIMEDRQLLNHILKDTRAKTRANTPSGVRADAKAQAAQAVKRHTKGQQQ
jgi:hypothetical protein